MIRTHLGAAALVAVLLAGSAQAHEPPATGSDAEPVVVAQSDGTRPRELQPRYEPAEPQPRSSYNNSYIFGMSRGLADSTIHPAVKAPLFALTVPLDLVFLPFAVIGGFFG